MFLTILGSVGIVIIVVTLLWRFKWELIIVSGESMSPTLGDGDLVLVDKKFKKDNLLDEIVILTPPLQQFLVIKRVKLIDNSKLNSKRYWVEGDNKDNSNDSRNYGFIGENNIEGKVIKTWQRKRAK